MSDSPARVFGFFAVCVSLCLAASFLLEKNFGSDGKICLSKSSDAFCIKYLSLTDIIGFKKFKAEKIAEEEARILDSIALAQRAKLLMEMSSLEDSIRVLQALADSSGTAFRLPDNDRIFWNALFEEWEQLTDSARLFRIIHYGDSQIEMDRMTAYIRRRLQEKFGGGGPGQISPLQLVPSSSVGVASSETWQRYIAYGLPDERYLNSRYGTLGTVFHFNSGYASVGASLPSKRDSMMARVEQVKVLTGRLQSSLSMALEGTGREISLNQSAEAAANLATWSIRPGKSYFKINFSGMGENTPIYSIALDAKSGIAVDNVPWRGSSGITFINMDKQALRKAYQLLDVRMVIFQFGGNSVPYLKDDKAVETYVGQIVRQLQHLWEVDSTLKILVIGPADMSYNEKGQMATYPILEKLVQRMGDTCTAVGAAFWNMYSAMGGKNSMVRWVEAKPAKAQPDYIHFTERGAEEMAKMLYEALEREFEIYLKKKRLNERRLEESTT